MIQKFYFIRTEHYDYFGGHKFKTLEADNISDALAMFRNSKKYDYDYGDSWSVTREIRHIFKYVPEPQRFHARSKYAWENMRERDKVFLDFTQEEIDYLLSLDDDIIIE